MNNTDQTYENDIAVIGMSGRFPKANNLDAYWQNLVDGLNCINKSDEKELHASGVPDHILKHDRFVNASSKLEDARYFDANFFGLSNIEATLMDPQIRLLLQTSWHALEDAGYAMNDLDFSVGNFCGMSTNSYLFKILGTNSLSEPIDPLLYRILNGKDFLATWISYKLNLTGPTMSVQTACSTSLLAIHLACQSLLNHECTMAMAGGVSYDANDSIGYLHVPESIFSKDGLCRPFDKEASGTIMGDGVGVIILKRAEDALKDKDHIYAMIKGTATNNDGSNKQSYTSPSVNFQRDVVLEALAVSDIHPETIGMVEAHGTGTLIGDPIEVSALTEAYREYTDQKQYCAVGSVKSNIGHLDAAAGIASIIKAILCVNKGNLVPSINYSNPNPALEIEASPFYVNENLTNWPDHLAVRRAGISSLGVGGSNVHIIVEQPPQIDHLQSEKGPYVIRLAALNQQSLDDQKKQWAEYIESNPEVRIEDVEFTSIYGRKVMPFRFSVVCEDKEELLAQLNGTISEKCFEGSGELVESVFLFPGQGSQFRNMAYELYEHNNDFKKDMDHCFEYAMTFCDINYKDIIFSDKNHLLKETENTQISLFIVEYCLAKQLMKSGVKPDAIIGHSLGEYVAACIVGCIALEDALKLVYHRGRLMGMMPEGAMVLVQLPKDDLSPLLIDGVAICVFNVDDSLVIGGSKEAIEKQILLFEQNQVKYKKLRVSHAYHTQMMEPVLADYEAILAEIEFKKFDTKIFSTLTGDLVKPEQFCTSKYWLDQIIQPVKYFDAVKDAVGYLSNPVFIEIGPGSGLSSFIKNILGQEASTINLLPKSSKKEETLNSFYKGKALLCAKGMVFQLPEVHSGKRVPLPGYTFRKDYFWKPKLNVSYKDFNELKASFHHRDKRYFSDRLRSSIEIQVNKNGLSDEMLDRLDQIHQQYLKDIKQLFSSEGNKIDDVIEVFYDDTSFEVKGQKKSTSNGLNKRRSVNNVFVKPKTETEVKIAKYWGIILGYQPVGILDNYFEVGGNSLLATQLINQIMKEMGVEITIDEVLSNNTVKDLAALVEEKEWLNSDAKLSNELLI